MEKKQYENHNQFRDEITRLEAVWTIMPDHLVERFLKELRKISSQYIKDIALIEREKDN